MSTTKMSEFTLVTVANDADHVPIIQSGDNAKITVADLFNGRAWPGLAADYPWTGQHSFLNGVFVGQGAATWWGASTLTDGTTLVSLRDTSLGDPFLNRVYISVIDSGIEQGIQLESNSSASLVSAYRGNSQASLSVGSNGLSRMVLMDSGVSVVEITGEGVRLPSLTESQRDAIAAPGDGLVIYQSDATPGVYGRIDGAWINLLGPGGSWPGLAADYDWTGYHTFEQGFSAGPASGDRSFLDYYSGSSNSILTVGRVDSGNTVSMLFYADSAKARIEYNLGGGNKCIDEVGTFADPNGNVSANMGSTYRSLAGGAGTTFWVKESGTGNTGWVGK